MAVSMVEIVEDLRAETLDLERMLAPLPGAAWETATPAPGWAVRDQVSHLAWFDDVAARYRALSVRELREWFRAARARLLDVLAGLDAKARIAWYGPDMSAASFATARLMETWAHGQDVADALGVSRPPTDRLRHVAHIGVRALPYSFAAHGRQVPAAPVRVEVTLPSGAVLALGPESAADVVRGAALDFCLVVTQRRHLADVALDVTGPVAAEWMPIAQAFAGPPGAGRSPGQFTRADEGV